MFKKIILAGFLIIFGLSFVHAQQKTVVNDAKAGQMLVGKHLFSLQWISWDYFGSAIVTNKNGTFYLKGEQKERKGGDYVKIDGIITDVNSREFKFDGIVITRISHINNGEPCRREGEMTFAVTNKRKYWRLQDINNPCDEAADYVDIYFR